MPLGHRTRPVRAALSCLVGGPVLPWHRIKCWTDPIGADWPEERGLGEIYTSLSTSHLPPPPAPTPPRLLLKLAWIFECVCWMKMSVLIKRIQEILPWIETEKVLERFCLISMPDATCESSPFLSGGNSHFMEWTGEGLFWGRLGLPCAALMRTESCWEAWFKLSESKRLRLWPCMSRVNHPWKQCKVQTWYLKYEIQFNKYSL